MPRRGVARGVISRVKWPDRVAEAIEPPATKCDKRGARATLAARAP
jgi:hypothetical protein